MTLKLKVQKDPSGDIWPVAIPEYESKDAAGLDLRSNETWRILPGSTQLVKTGLKMELPHGTVGMVCSRSGLALKKSVFVLNAPGIIDADYRGEIGIILHNAGTEAFEVSIGDRVAQLVIVKVEQVDVVEEEVYNVTERGANGFGSTGVN